MRIVGASTAFYVVRHPSLVKNVTNCDFDVCLIVKLNEKIFCLISLQKNKKSYLLVEHHRIGHLPVPGY